MIDELTVLRESRPETAPPDSSVTIQAREALLFAARGGRSRRRYVVRALAGAAAAALVLGVTGVVNLRGGNDGATAAAAAILHRSAATVESAPVPNPGQYLYVRSSETDWNVDGTKSNRSIGERTEVETWIPGNSSEVVLQRLRNADGTTVVTQLPTNTPALYRDYPQDPEKLLKAIRSLAVEGGSGNADGDEATWHEAYAILQDVLAPKELKSDVLRALSGMKGVKILDKNAKVGDRVGVALGLDRAYVPHLVFDSDTGTYLGVTGTPERGKKHDGSQTSRYTVAMESRITNERPVLKERARNQVQQQTEAREYLEGR